MPGPESSSQPCKPAITVAGGGRTSLEMRLSKCNWVRSGANQRICSRVGSLTLLLVTAACVQIRSPVPAQTNTQ